MLRPSVLGAFCLAIGACSFPASSGNAVVDATAPDAGGVDAGPGNDAAAARCKFTFVDVCALTPGPALAFTTAPVAPINTSLPGSCPHLVQQGNGKPELCVRYATSIAIAEGVVIRAIGARPLVLVASTSITVAGRLDVSSTRQRLGSVPVAESVGAGGAGSSCGFTRAPQSDAGGGGGAAGASFSGKGGDGGIGDLNDSVGNDGNAESGLANSLVEINTISSLRGGCRGQVGGSFGNSVVGEPPGAGGPPGGAIYLAAAEQITIESNGGVSANGGGGMGGGSQSGGSGGGSGGLIVLEATAIHRLGALTANGGGGGEGGIYLEDNSVRYTGFPGGDGRLDDTAAAGADSPSSPGNGGNGGAGVVRDGTGGTQSNGGGGGGGGASGFILLLGAVDGAGLISPPAN